MTDPASGAAVRFTGTVRAEENGLPIAGLEYEAYEPMASNVITAIFAALDAAHPFQSARFQHRLGFVPVGAAAIIVEVVSKHRAEAFTVASGFMDQLKRDVPIWKVRAVPS